jgi:hypothetical protein
MALFLALKDHATFQHVVELSMSYESLIGGIIAFNDMRTELQEAMLPGGTFAGGIVMTVLTKEQHDALEPKIFDVNNMIEVIRASSKISPRRSNSSAIRAAKSAWRETSSWAWSQPRR